MVRWSIRHQLQIIRRILVVGRHIKRHNPLQKRLRGLVVRKQRIAINVVQLALVRRGAARVDARNQRRIQAQKMVQPRFNRVLFGISDRLFEAQLLQNSIRAGIFRSLGPLVFTGTPTRARAAQPTAVAPKLTDQLERQRSPRALISVNCGGHEDQIRAQKLLHERERNRSGFINHDQLGLPQLVVILRLDVLDHLPMLLENIHAHNCLVEAHVGGADQLVVDVLCVVERIKAAEEKLKERLEILRRGRCDENIRVAVLNRSCDRQTKRRRLAAAARSRQRNGRFQIFLADAFDEAQHRLCLVQSSARIHQRLSRADIDETRLQLLQFALRFRLGLFARGGTDRRQVEGVG
eukprot:Sdes_comp15523_c0_seq1m4476